MASRGVNKVVLIGNIGQDPESRFLPSGGMVVNLSLATSESWKDKSTGQDQTVTEWHRLVVFGKLAEIVNQYVKKGSKLYVEGKLKTRQWDKDGVKMYSTEIVVNEMQILDGKQDGGAPAQPRQQAQTQSQPDYTNPDFDDDLDF